MHDLYSLDIKNIIKDVAHGHIETKTIEEKSWFNLRTKLVKVPMTEEDCVTLEKEFLNKVGDCIINLCERILDNPEDLICLEDKMTHEGNFEYKVEDFTIFFSRFSAPFSGYETTFQPSYLCDTQQEIDLIKKCLDRIVIWNNGRWQRDTL